MSEPLAPPPPPPPPPGDAARPGLPWEDRARHGAFQGFVDTVKLLVGSPAEGFARARRRGDLVSPVAYAVLIGWIGVVAERIWTLLIGTSILSFLPGEAREGAALGFAVSGLGLAVALVLAPIFVLVGLFVWGAILHLFLMLYGATRTSDTGFEGTLRAVSWSTTSQLGQVVPFVGGLVALVWSVVLQTIALAQFHRTTQGKALAAVLTPLLLCCVCIAFAFAGVVAMIVGAAAGAAD
jgi:hypothetical protein